MFREVFYLTKKELEQLEKGIQKLEKLAVADKISNIHSRGGHIR